MICYSVANYLEVHYPALLFVGFGLNLSHFGSILSPEEHTAVHFLCIYLTLQHFCSRMSLRNHHIRAGPLRPSHNVQVALLTFSEWKCLQRGKALPKRLANRSICIAYLHLTAGYITLAFTMSRSASLSQITQEPLYIHSSIYFNRTSLPHPIIPFYYP